MLYSKETALTSTPSLRLILPYVAIGISILALSTSAIFVRYAEAPGPVTGFYRMAIASLIMTPFILARFRRRFPLHRKNIIYPIAGGIFSGFDLGTWTISLAFTTASNATLLGNTAPLWVALVSWLFFRRVLRRDFWLGLVLAMGGAALVMGGDFIFHPRLGIGDALASLTGVFYAGYYVFTELGRRSLDPLAYLWTVTVSASLTLLGFNMVMGNTLVGYSASTWMAFLGTAVISQLIGYIAISYALGHLPASVVSATMIGQPVVTTIIAIPLLGEIPQGLQIIGGVIALAGIYWVNHSHDQARKSEGQPGPLSI
jgi:drug/metabolite transporter (DMT)-like permease